MKIKRLFVQCDGREVNGCLVCLISRLTEHSQCRESAVGSNRSSLSKYF